ncbi:MAG: hypothetical protein ACYCQJ_15675 [Nitrososphaerales archaeon]
MDKSFVSSDIPPDVNNLLLDCFYVSDLHAGCKLNIGSRSYANSTVLDSVLRKLGGESRDKTISWLNSLVDRGVNLGHEYPSWRSQIIEALAGLKKSITGLKTTYHNDQWVVSQLQVLEKRIEERTLRKTFQVQENLVDKRTKTD